MFVYVIIRCCGSSGVVANRMIKHCNVILCTFSFASLNEQPPFDALSYVWGDLHGTIVIHIDGHEVLIT